MNTEIISAPPESQNKYTMLQPEGMKQFQIFSSEFLKSPFANHVAFHNDTETNDERYISYISPEDNKEYVIELIVAIPSSVQTAYDPGTFATLPAWKVSWGDYNSAAIHHFLTSMWSQNDAQNFADSLKYLILDARQDEDALYEIKFEQFKLAAQSWKALQEKPAMPEEARNHKILAQDAIRNKDAVKARNEYDAALKIFPCWPEGQFNEAIIAGETGGYRTAILHMKCYLELSPDASDAQSDKDKMVIWRDKMGQ